MFQADPEWQIQRGRGSWGTHVNFIVVPTSHRMLIFAAALSVYPPRTAFQYFDIEWLQNYLIIIIISPAFISMLSSNSAVTWTHCCVTEFGCRHWNIIPIILAQANLGLICPKSAVPEQLWIFTSFAFLAKSNLVSRTWDALLVCSSWWTLCICCPEAFYFLDRC